MSQKRCCENCVYAGQIRDGAKTLCICSNTPDSPRQTVVVPPDGVCPHFRRKHVRTGKSTPKKSDDPWVRYIPLTQGQYAIVDADDYAWLSQHNWCAARSGNTYYAYRRRNGRLISMHVEIMVPADGYLVDHINGHGGDNRRSNMRICTRGQNNRNRRKQKTPCTSQYKGVRKDKTTGKCCARIRHKGVPICLGTYDDEIEAARAYDRAARKFHGKFARLNFPEEWVTGQWKPVNHETEDG